ncbi:MAG TPA: pyridoxamine 5'-phosphate oxidase family protein [Parafilimonas sp.]|nr:pyridoxamine 5'-phosphate oxidase family protein [Parafilimonas sp.]
MLGELTNDEIEEVLKHNVLGRIGCYNDNKIYVVPVNYVYDGRHILAHSKEGLKIFMMRKNPDICFEVDEMQNFTNWRSVILWGVYEELSDERSRYYAMKAFVEKMMHIKVSATAQPSHHSHAYARSKAVIYRIVITEKSGRFERD